jgi:methionyl-tRNA formyltransferase
MNIVFIGASKFGLQCLDCCIEMPDVNVVGVITAPEKFYISYRPSGVTNVLHADLAARAREERIPVAMLDSTMSDPTLFDEVKVWQPDLFIVAGWYHIIPKHWRAIAPAYGLHASLLPDYRGGAPLVWAMINGEVKTGITLFLMSDGVDSGPIAGQVEESIQIDDTIATLYTRIEKRGLALLRNVLAEMAKGVVTLRQQDESKSRIMRQRVPEDGLINWRQDAKTIDRFIRAQTRPYPGAFSTLNGNPITIWRAQPDPQCRNYKPGDVFQITGNSYAVACAVGSLVLKEVSYLQRIYIGHQIFEFLGKSSCRLGDAP